jgi:hypothetical protein
MSGSNSSAFRSSSMLRRVLAALLLAPGGVVLPPSAAPAGTVQTLKGVGGQQKVFILIGRGLPALPLVMPCYRMDPWVVHSNRPVVSWQWWGSHSCKAWLQHLTWLTFQSVHF